MAGQDVIYAREEPIRIGSREMPIDPEFVISESNHRIANNLALLVSAVSIRTAEVSRRSHDLDREEVALILGEVSARISTVSWLHRFLSREPEAERVNVNAHLYELCEMLLSALSDPDRMKLVRTGTGECFVTPRQVVPLCLIVTEVVTNSLKYAHPTGVRGTISVGCRELVDRSLVVEVADDGVGLPEDYDLLAEGGTGARTIRALANQLGAAVEFVSSPIGLAFRMTIPRKTRET